MKKHELKRHMATFIIIAVFVFSFGMGESLAAEKVRFIYSGQAMAYLARMVASEKGLFAKEGLDVEAVDIPGGPKATAAVIGGSADLIELGFFHCLKAARQGFDVVSFGCGMNRWPMAYLMKEDMMKKKGITVNSSIDDKIKAMKGLVIGCSSVGSGTDLIPRAFLANRGINPDTEVSFFPFGDVKAGIAAFETGKIDVFQWWAPVPDMLEQKGTGKIVFDMGKGDVPEFKEYVWGSYFGTGKYVRENPQLIEKFMRAIIAAVDIIHNDKEAVVPIIEPMWKDVPRNLLLKAIENIGQSISADPRITKQGWADNIKIYFPDATGEDMKKMAYEKVVDNQFVDKLLKKGK